MTAETPSSVRAVTETRLVMSVPELVMNVLAPSITHSAPSLTAFVAVAPASEPPPGSVRPKAARRRPVTRSGSHCSFWSSVPYSDTGLAPSDTPASRVIPIDWSTRPTSSMAMHCVVRPASAPPHSASNMRPKRPRSPIARTVSVGKMWSRSHTSAWGAISASANSRTTPRNASCSSVNSSIGA